MKENKKSINPLIITLLVALLVLAISIAFKITPKDVFDGTISYKEENTNKEVVAEENKQEETEKTKKEPMTYADFMANLPEYDGKHISITINDNEPFFTTEDKKVTDTFYVYSELDELGRTDKVIANVTKSEFPEGLRKGDLSTITPAGWNQVNVKKTFNKTITNINGDQSDYLYARCHVLAWSLGGEELDPRNIFTGTIACNSAMRQVEESIWEFLDIAQTDHVLYRVTPVYVDDELLPRGVLMEGYAIEAKGLFLDFNVFVFNEEPGYIINHLDGSVSVSD